MEHVFFLYVKALIENVDLTEKSNHFIKNAKLIQYLITAAVFVKNSGELPRLR